MTTRADADALREIAGRVDEWAVDVDGEWGSGTSGPDEPGEELRRDAAELRRIARVLEWGGPE